MINTVESLVKAIESKYEETVSKDEIPNINNQNERESVESNTKVSRNESLDHSQLADFQCINSSFCSDVIDDSEEEPDVILFSDADLEILRSQTTQLSQQKLSEKGQNGSMKEGSIVDNTYKSKDKLLLPKNENYLCSKTISEETTPSNNVCITPQQKQTLAHEKIIDDFQSTTFIVKKEKGTNRGIKWNKPSSTNTPNGTLISAFPNSINSKMARKPYYRVGLSRKLKVDSLHNYLHKKE